MPTLAGPNWRLTGSTAGGGTLPGATSRGYSSAYGGVPTVPNPVTTAGQALSGNIGNLGSIYNLTSGIDTSGINTLSAATQGAVPGLTSRLHGELPGDVINQIMQQAAERGIASGTGFRGADYLKALGLTSLGVSTGAAGELESAIGRAPLVNPNNLLVTPEEQQQAQMAANIYRSAPIPSAAAGASLGNAQAGIRAGMGSVPTFGGVSAYGGGARDELGFPIDTSWDRSDAWSQPNPPAVGPINPSAPFVSSPDLYTNWQAQFMRQPQDQELASVGPPDEENYE